MGIFLEPKQLDKQNFSISRSVQGSLCVGNLPSATLTWKPGGTGSACIDPMVSVVFHSSALSGPFFFFFYLKPSYKEITLTQLARNILHCDI